MAMAKAKTPKRSALKSTKTTKAPSKRGKRIKRDPHKEYRERMKAVGVRAVPSLEDSASVIRRRISTQNVVLDKLFQGGVPLGRIIEIYGQPHIGKSTTLDHIFAQVLNEDGVGILADTEVARDTKYSSRIGIDIAKLHCLEWADSETYIENVVEAFRETVLFWKKEYPDTPVIMGWDALGSTSPREEVGKGLAPAKAHQPGAAAKAIRAAMRQITPLLGHSLITMIILNHEYENVNSGPFAGPKRSTYGGGGIKYAGDIRLRLSRKGSIKRSDGLVIGNHVIARLEKDRFGNSGMEGEFAIINGEGVHNCWSIFNALSNAKVIVKSGGATSSWSEMNIDGQDLKFQGWNGLYSLCNEDPTLFPRLVSVYQQLPL